MERLFKLKQSGSNVRTEIIAGVTTFFTMAYIMFVNPNILSTTGMNWNGVFVATILAAVIGTLVMGFVANVPYAQAAGMGLNAFFAYTVCGALEFTWQQALTMVFICGIINVLITVTKVRKIIIKSIPLSLQSAIGGAIGLFIAYIGLKSGGFFSFTADPGTFINLPSGGIVADSSIIPALADFNTTGIILALIGLVITVALITLKVKGAILIGIIATTIIGIPMGIVSVPDIKAWFDTSAVGDITQTAFKLDFAGIFGDQAKIIPAIITIFAFSLSDTFDTIGTFIGTGRVSGIFDKDDEKALSEGKGFKSKMDRALFADATATSVGALLGTSNTTTYVESSAGIAAGGRTGLTSVVVAVLFLICLPFSAVFGMVPAQATSAALIVVGVMMAASFKDVGWSSFEVAAPAFLTVAIMVLGYSISYGIAAGFIFYCLIKLFSGKPREVHPIIYGASILFIINFVLMALGTI
ncbi:MAG TPA: guanine permease [Ruminococcaceae bacterium]|nr:guanine permease [Oscillospiraceae bacterium]